MTGKGIFIVYTTSYIPGIGQLYVIITKRKKNEDNKTITESFCIIPETNKKWKARALQITFNGFEILPEFDSIITNETLNQVKNYLIHNEIEPKLSKQLDILPSPIDIDFKEINQNELLNLHWQCPGFINKTYQRTNCLTLKEYLEPIMKINIRMDSEVLDF